jgi:hypothetical protein
MCEPAQSVAPAQANHATHTLTVRAVPLYGRCACSHRGASCSRRLRSRGSRPRAAGTPFRHPTARLHIVAHLPDADYAHHPAARRCNQPRLLRTMARCTLDPGFALGSHQNRNPWTLRKPPLGPSLRTLCSSICSMTVPFTKAYRTSHLILEWQYGSNVLRGHRAFVQPRLDGPTVDDSDVFPRLVVMPAA